MTRKLLMCFSTLVFVLIVLLATVNTASASTDNNISVVLRNYIGNKTEITVTVKGKYEIVGDSNTLTEGNTYKIKVEGTNVTLYKGNTKIKTYQRLQTKPVKYGTANYITIDGRRYLGEMDFYREYRDNKNTVRPMNTLPLEDYLKGVVPGEMFPNWHMEAYKAQAVAARSYALYKKASRLDGIINDTTDFQVYEGYTWYQNIQKYRDTTAAINATKGQILQYNNKPIEAYYSSTNGGTQLSARNSWGSSLSDYPYLKKQNDPYSTRAGAHLNWSFSVKKKQIDVTKLDLAKPEDWWAKTKESDERIMNAMKNSVIANDASLKDAEIKIVEFSNLSFTTSFGEGDILSGSFKISYFVKGPKGFVMEDGELKLHQKTISSRTDLLRKYFGTDPKTNIQYLRSPNVKKVSEDDTKFTVTGNGFGHGIGLSQYGAQQQAKEGRSYKQILDFYYRGTNWYNTINQSINSSLQGINRYETSAAIANYGWSSAKTVVLGRGDNPVDALTGSVLAKKYDAPLLLVRPDRIDDSVLKALDKYRPNKIYILGGISAISEKVENQLKQQYTRDVERVNGAWRADTSVAIAKEIASSSKEVIVTTDSEKSSDALSIASYAAKEQIPILYSKTDSTADSVINYIKHSGIKKITIIGGKSAISSKVEERLKLIVGSKNVSRISGENRFDTSVKIVEQLNLDPRNIFFARGENTDFIDALPGSVLAAKYDAPIILVRKDLVPPEVRSYINTEISFIPYIHYLGGEAAISKKTRNNLQEIILK